VSVYVVFAAGALVRLLEISLRQYKKFDPFFVLLTILSGLALVILSYKGEMDIDHWVALPIGIYIVGTILFYKRLIPKVNESSLLLFTLICVYVAYTVFGFFINLLWIFILPIILSVFGIIFSKKKLTSIRRVLTMQMFALQAFGLALWMVLSIDVSVVNWFSLIMYGYVLFTLVSYGLYLFYLILILANYIHVRHFSIKNKFYDGYIDVDITFSGIVMVLSLFLIFIAVDTLTTIALPLLVSVALALGWTLTGMPKTHRIENLK